MELVFLICLPHILKPTLHPAVACRTPKIQNWQSAAPKRLSEIQAITMILARFRRNSQAPTIHALYGAIVAQARSVAFYADYRVPDTVEGRFNLIVLHLLLLLNRRGRRAGRPPNGSWMWRWHAISLRKATMADPRTWRSMRGRR